VTSELETVQTEVVEDVVEAAPSLIVSIVGVKLLP
jgi:hypothetical protein